MVLSLSSGKFREPAECIVRVGAAGQEIADLYPYLAEVTVDARRDRATVATLRFESRRDEHGRWSVQDAGVLAPWQRIVIEAAFGSTVEEVMRGYIREVAADYPEDPGGSAVTVECQDDSILLDREHVRTVWGADAPTDDGTLLRSVLARHGLTLDLQSGTGLSNLVCSQDSTDVAFLRRRAEASGYELLFRDGKVYFGPMRLDAKPQPPILVYAGRDTNCYRFSAKADGHQPDRVAFDVASATGADVVHREVKPDLPLLGTQPADSSRSGLGDFTWRLTRQGAANEEELAARAQGRANAMAMKVRAEGELDGSLYGHVLRAGEPVGVDGVGEWLGGVYYVDTVNHRFSVDGYRQGFTLLRNAYGDNLTGAASPLAGL